MKAATFNRTEIFKAAWSEVKAYFARCAERGLTSTPTMAQKLSYELRQAWHRAKMAVYRAQVAEAPKADRIRAALSDLQNNDHWTAADYATHEALTTELRDLDAEDRADELEKRDLIESAKGRIASVTFTKKDGTERTMKVQPAKLKFHVQGDNASESARKAVAVRKARHPHLIPVWDVEAQAPRSVNLATITAITVDGMTRAYA